MEQTIDANKTRKKGEKGKLFAHSSFHLDSSTPATKKMTASTRTTKGVLDRCALVVVHHGVPKRLSPIVEGEQLGDGRQPLRHERQVEEYPGQEHHREGDGVGGGEAVSSSWMKRAMIMPMLLNSAEDMMITKIANGVRVRCISNTSPEYDTPAVLAAHAKAVGADTTTWTFLTGDRKTVDRLAARFGVGVIRGPAGETEITHNLRTGLFAADGTLIKMYPGSEWGPGTVLTDLRAHLR